MHEILALHRAPATMVCTGCKRGGHGVQMKTRPAVSSRELPGASGEPADEEFTRIRDSRCRINANHLRGAYYNQGRMAARLPRRVARVVGWELGERGDGHGALAYPRVVTRILPHDAFDARLRELTARVAHGVE